MLYVKGVHKSRVLVFQAAVKYNVRGSDGHECEITRAD
jgi:hypothetical protein